MPQKLENNSPIKGENLSVSLPSFRKKPTSLGKISLHLHCLLQMSSTAETILFASEQLAIYGYFAILIAGVIGNVCNILVFTCFKLFRRNQCAFYLIVESMSNCALLLIALPFRITEVAFNYDTTRGAVVWCKLKSMISYTLAIISFSAICFAAIDQFLSTNNQAWLKQMSTLKLAHRLVYGAILIWIIYGSLFLIFFEIQPNSSCAISNVAFARYFSFFHYIILNGIIPVSVSSTFSLLAYLNVRRIVRLRMPVIRRKLDKQLTAMVLADVVFLVATILPSDILRIYTLNVTPNPNDSVQIAVVQLISAIGYALYYMNTSVCHLLLLTSFIVFVLGCILYILSGITEISPSS
jgi:hypothetical protein